MGWGGVGVGWGGGGGGGGGHEPIYVISFFQEREKRGIRKKKRAQKNLQ